MTKGRKPAARALGRPPKFSEPTRVVTVTLPRSTLADLEEIDEDRARAIVHATEVALSLRTEGAHSVELFAVSRDSAVITVPFSRALAKIRGLTLIRILPSRYLVILEQGISLPELEIAALDLLETLEPGDGDRMLIERFIEQLRVLRRANRTETREVILVAL